MVPFYKKIGFQHTGLRHTEPQWKDDRLLNIMMANIRELTVGRGVNPFYWNIMWREVAQYFSAQGAIDASGIDKVRLMVYKSLGPLSTLALHLMRFARPRNKKVSDSR
jgi:hypothetical protein